jgi:TRAP-type C4-dicarboxylate transport system permease large subunit
MKRHGYSGRLAWYYCRRNAGYPDTTSVPLVIYAILTRQNIAKLFAAI